MDCPATAIGKTPAAACLSINIAEVTVTSCHFLLCVRGVLGQKYVLSGMQSIVQVLPKSEGLSTALQIPYAHSYTKRASAFHLHPTGPAPPRPAL